MLTDILEKIAEFNEGLYEPFNGWIESFNLPEWLADGIIDSVQTLFILFLIFFIIEIIEYFFSGKINSIVKNTSKGAPLLGSFAAIFPQCGFSIMASTLYVEKYITKGTLIAIYLATSDEAIPILLATPSKMYYLIPLIFMKLVIAVIAGYAIDYVLKDDKFVVSPKNIDSTEGCCHHEVGRKRKRDLIYHPVKHTLNIFVFILIITLILNGFIAFVKALGLLNVHTIESLKLFMPFITAFLGLIPNCAISITLTMLLIKGSITFGAAMAGLLSNGGLGILVLLKNNDNKNDTIKIVKILLLVSIVSGYLLQIFTNF